MRDLLFKNLTSNDKRRKAISSSEIVDNQGVRSIIRRHLVCIAKEIKDSQAQQPLPYLYILKERNTKEHKERFFCKIKGSVYAVHKGRLFLILYMHSLQINLVTLPQGLMEYS